MGYKGGAGRQYRKDGELRTPSNQQKKAARSAECKTGRMGLKRSQRAPSEPLFACEAGEFSSSVKASSVHAWSTLLALSGLAEMSAQRAHGYNR